MMNLPTYSFTHVYKKDLQRSKIELDNLFYNLLYKYILGKKKGGGSIFEVHKSQPIGS